MGNAIATAGQLVSATKDPLDLDAEKERMRDVQDDFFWATLEQVHGCTLLDTSKLYNLYESTRYIVNNRIPGSIVECGVFLGGAMMLVATTLRELGDEERDIYLYDTFTGFADDVTEFDISYRGKKVGTQKIQHFMEATQNNLFQTGYPESKIHFIEGDVAESLDGNLPSTISMLRLDTDTYASTKIELELAYPLLVPRGVLLIDDYGYSNGARKAVDEYFENSSSKPFFQRPNYSLRTAIKS